MMHKGGCHCGAVRFEFDCPSPVTVYQCNCSICRMTGLLHVIIPRDAFRLLTPWDALGNYTFNTGVAQHYFCPVCGVRPFYVPRSNPDGISVNYRCVDAGSLVAAAIEDYDGANWEAAPSLSHLSKAQP